MQLKQHIENGTDGSAITHEATTAVYFNGQLVGEMSWDDLEEQSDKVLSQPGGEVLYVFEDSSILRLRFSDSDHITCQTGIKGPTPPSLINMPTQSEATN